MYNMYKEIVQNYDFNNDFKIIKINEKFFSA